LAGYALAYQFEENDDKASSIIVYKGELKGTHIFQSHPSSLPQYTVSILEAFGNPIFDQMVLKLYTSAMSTCGHRVAVILQEKNVPYELIQPNWAAKEHKSEAWTKNQPFGQMPYIDVSTVTPPLYYDLPPIRSYLFVTDTTGRTTGSYSSKAVPSVAILRPSMHHPEHLSSRVIPVMSKPWRLSTRLQASSCVISNPLPVASLKRRFSKST